MTEKNLSESKRGFGKYLGLSFLIGFGFFNMGLMDPLYDTYVPLFLGRYIGSKAVVGAIMTVDNILQLFLISFVSIWSDRTRTRIGRRMPFIIVMLPISAILFSLFPPMAGSSLFALIVIIFLFNIFKTSVRGPIVALMPDTIPGDYRSEANGVINTMAGIGTVVATLLLARLFDVKESLPFNITSIAIIAAVLILFIFVREKLPEKEETEEKKVPVLKSIMQIFRSEDFSVARILIALFVWFTGFQGAIPFLGLYLVEYMGVSGGNAAMAQGMSGIASVLMAVPAGYIAHRIGRRRYIRISLFCLAVILFLISLSGHIGKTMGLSSANSLNIFLILMFIFGAFYVGVIVNSFPMLWQMATFGNMGIYTGLYYTFSQSASILSPPITGAIIDLVGYPGIFIFAGICMLVSWFVMAGVKAGEPAKAV
ncbi:MFS transporter [Spirochaetia bacterium]|nr:MFS transporter [Spirochaetia bacterium]